MNSQSSSALTAVQSSRWKDYLALMKLRLSTSVVFSSTAGYLLGASQVILWEMFALIFGGILVTGAANAFNQIIEKEQDSLMNRTANRPVASGRMGIPEAMTLAFIILIGGLALLYTLNFLTFIFGALSVVLYALVYTPLKGKTSFAVFVGAFPGAIPIMLGWVAATNSFGVEPGTLFAWQFLWQFPHFWAIAWLLHNDYKKAGYVLLPSGQPDRASAFQALLYATGLLMLVLLPYFGLAGTLKISGIATSIIFTLGLVLVYYAYRLFKRLDNASARKLMLFSILYLTLTQIIWVIDRFI
ncbi:MAG: protoheme IX farnesyltransferase [Cryomorphaceae bacterium]|nr:protoheme IX farnesyltransferase [Cryomorphaceae bacterium]